MSATTKEIVHQGWLTKSPPKNSIFKPRWRRRWFLLKSGQYPNQFVLEYFTDESCRRQKGLINLDECEQVAGPLNVQDRHRYTFHLRTPSRTYYLAADTETEMNKWVQGICQVCGLKIIEDDNEGNVVYARPSNENTKPVEAEPTESHNESDGSSPTPSNKSPSGPYIPISECFTGKPIIFNPSNNEEVTYYNTSSFPFPPKVNWATHPRESKDANDHHPPPSDGNKVQQQQQVQRPNETHYAPPRPPKKNSSKPTTPTTTTVQSSKPSWSPSPKCPPGPGPEQVQSQASLSAGVYENVEENNPDSSSPSSSLHSPPGSAGGLYCNIPDITESKTAAGASVYQNPQPATSPSPSCSSGNSMSAIPPKVDRNLKPEVRKANEINAAASKNHHHPSASNSQSRVGCMTLPNKSSQSNLYNSGGGPFRGPEIDRTRKPSDGHLTLSSTPAQLRYQSAMQNDHRVSSSSSSNMRTNTSTLPSSYRRRAGPLISPHDKKSPAYHEYETAQELSGTYMQIDCKAIKESESRSQTLKLPSNKKVVGGIISPSEGSVEYRLIDHVKTKALNQMRLDREKQLQTNTTRH